MKKFPKQIYVTRDNPGTNDEFLTVNHSLQKYPQIRGKKIRENGKWVVEQKTPNCG